ncbi:hypothetical protein D3C78_1297020 [compost metagenome]
MDELDLVGLAVPGVATLEEAAWNPHHHRRREAVGRAPAHGAAIVDLLDRRVRVLAELDFRHRHQAGQRHADRAADDAFLRQAGIEYPAFAVLVLQAQGHRVHATLGANVFTEYHHLRIARQFVVQGAANRGNHVDALALGLGRIAAVWCLVALEPLSAALL